MAILRPQDVLVVALCVAAHLIYRSRRKARLPSPPGLPRLPLIGNAFSIPLKNGHLFYKELGERLGSKIMYLEALGQPIVVLNDATMAKELLEKRSALYSSRPRSTMVTDVVKMDVFFFALQPYGNEWRNHRRLFQQYFSPRTLARDEEKELEFTWKTLLPNLYQSPHNLHEHVRSFVGGIATAMTYGLKVRRNHDPNVQLSEEAFSSGSQAGAHGKYLVDIIPLLRYLPEWMPGVSFKKFARECTTLLNRVMEEPYAATLRSMKDGTAPDSFVSNSLERYHDSPDYDFQAKHIKETATMVYGAASETTVSACMTFLLAMLNHPDIQRKVQQEIDSVVGYDRLPTFTDKPHLSYLSAVLRKVLRWNPILPLGIPHSSSEEDVYEGYYIPKGTIVIANAYAMLHDEEIFPNPNEFKPERFLNNDGRTFDPEEIATFGFGRRICPGSHIGLSTLYIFAVSTLALFDVSPELDAEGKPMRVVPEWSTGSIVSEPLPFQCKLTPRQGKDVEGMLRDYLDVEAV